MIDHDFDSAPKSRSVWDLIEKASASWSMSDKLLRVWITMMMSIFMVKVTVTEGNNQPEAPSGHG
jgi:hypothetical protein